MRRMMILLWCMGSVLGAGPETQNASGQRDVFSFQQMTGNALDCWMKNDGMVVSHQVTGTSGMTWPEGTGNSAIFAAGPWLVGIGTEGIKSAVVEFSSELFPGGVNDGVPGDPYAAENRIYLLDAGDTGSQDYLEWPVDLGAPTNYSGNPLILGEQAAWWVSNDVESRDYGQNNFYTDPIMVEEQFYSFVFDQPGVFQDMIVVDITLINHGELLSDAYAGIWVDPDLGDATDDFVGYDSTLEMGFAYNDGGDATFGFQTPATGCILLRTPTQNGDEVGITAFAKYINSFGANWSDPNTAEEAYNYLQGLNSIGEPYINPIDSTITTFIHPGDPVTEEGWIDAMTHPSGDRRFLLSSGPFDFAPGDTQHLSFAFLMAQGYDYLNSITTLKSKAGNLSDLFQEGIAADIDLNELYHLGDDVILEASWITIEPDVVDVSYAWQIVSQPAGSELSLDGETGAIVSFTPEHAGSYGVEMTLTSNLGTSILASVDVLVVNNSPPTAEFELEMDVVELGESLTLDGSASTDPDGDGMAFHWEAPYGLIDMPNAQSTIITYWRTGFQEVELFVTDPYHQDSSRDTVEVLPHLQGMQIQENVMEPQWEGGSLAMLKRENTLIVYDQITGLALFYDLFGESMAQFLEIQLSPYLTLVDWRDQQIWYLQGGGLCVDSVSIGGEVINLLSDYLTGADGMYASAQQFKMQGDEALVVNYDNYLFKLDISDPGSPIMMDYLDLSLQGFWLPELAVNSNYLFLREGGYPDGMLQIRTLESFEEVANVEFPFGVNKMSVSEDLLLAGTLYDDFVHIYDLSNVSDPSLIQSFSSPGIFDLQVSSPRHYGYFHGDGIMGLELGGIYELYDISDPESPVFLSSWWDGYFAHNIQGEDEDFYLLQQPGESAGRYQGVNHLRVVPLAIGADEEIMPDRLKLYPNFPNPFNPDTHLSYELGETSEVLVQIFDIQGRLISMLENKTRPAGHYEVIWNGKDGVGKPLGSGIYFARISAGAESCQIKMLLLK